jgi:hypothetical protein
MSSRRETLAFAATLVAMLAGLFGESLFGGKALSPADVLLVSASFRDERGPLYEPANRLLMDPVLQFQPWLEHNRAMIRRGRLPLWNDRAGCGAPHLANGQSAVFDPFHAIAYLGTLPGALAWMAFARLAVAGLGMFLLSRSWGLGPWGRWFSGLAFPPCGFLMAWLLYPVASVAVWMPWLFLATDRALDRPGSRSVGLLALAVGCVLLGGHVQTSAHVLLAAGLYVAWRIATGRVVPPMIPGPSSPHIVPPTQPSPTRGEGFGTPSPFRVGPRGLAAWGAGVALGVAVAAVEVVPLGAYLARSPVWADRERQRPSAWSLTRPRLLDAACTALPYAFGSQRRGHPNLAKALGVHNLNEAAGGFAGLATLAWLAPLGWSSRRGWPRAGFLAVLVAVGAMGAFGVPPVENLLRASPVLSVTDNRRLTLWVAFGLVLLGGAGLDRLPSSRVRRAGPWLGVAAATALLAMAGVVDRAGPRLRERALAHYAEAAAATPGADAAVYRERAERQARAVRAFVPRYLATAAAQVLAMAAMAEAWRRGRASPALLRSALLGLALADLIGFGAGLNPAIAAGDDRVGGAVVDYLRRGVGPDARIIGVGEELPPNVLMRYGLADARNYDSVELSRSLSWFAPLYGPGGASRTSRREVTWEGVLRARDRLGEAMVAAAVGASPPPDGAFARVDRVGEAWVARLDARPWAQAERHPARLAVRRECGRAWIVFEADRDDRLVVRETFDPGWRADLDGRDAAIEPYRGTFLAVPVASGRHRLTLRYDPPEVRAAVGISAFAGAVAVFALTGFRPFRSTRIMGRRLGRTQAAGLKSALCSSPPNPEG